MEEKNPIQVAGRLFGAVEYIAESGPSGLMEIARFLGINKSTARRIMRSLIYMDYVRQDPESGKYFLTERLGQIASGQSD